MIQAKLTVSFNPKKVFKTLEEAQTKGLEMAIFRWETETKMLTTLENHVVTGRYRASINNNSSDGLPHQTVADSRPDDGVHEVIKYNHIKAGSNVEYAAALEKRYGLMLRGLDRAKDKMVKSYLEVIMERI